MIRAIPTDLIKLVLPTALVPNNSTPAIPPAIPLAVGGKGALPPENLDEESSLKLCISSWPEGITPLTHYSESRRLYENSESKEVAHSDWIHTQIETYGLSFDIELEVKMKDKALLDYHQNIEKILL